MTRDVLTIKSFIMKKFRNLGTVLSKDQQSKIIGGLDDFRPPCEEHGEDGQCCYYVLVHGNEDRDFDKWVKKKVCYGGFN
ncbi:hypothetical protein BKI52_03580 [marine bacterium AO1-C]|nr:hypothetical protein BKI52_03580 [marine bacterium AO1-C]